MFIWIDLDLVCAIVFGRGALVDLLVGALGALGALGGPLVGDSGRGPLGRNAPFASPPLRLDADGRFRFGSITESTAVVTVRIENDPWEAARIVAGTRSKPASRPASSATSAVSRTSCRWRGGVKTKSDSSALTEKPRRSIDSLISAGGM